MVEFGKREGFVPKPKTPEVGPAQHSPEREMELLRGLGDEQLNALLDSWEEIRAFQDSPGGGHSDDPRRLTTLFGKINTRLRELGKKELESMDRLP